MIQFTDVARNHSQYEGQTFEYGEITDAIYVKPLLEGDAENKYIAALPIPPDQRTVFRMNNRQSAGYDMDNSNKSDSQKMLEICNLENFRVPLPSVYQLWTSIYQCMEQSYSRRKVLKSPLKAKNVTVNGEQVAVDGDLISTDDSAVIGFNMIGQSGCGKTSSLRIALDYYPKVIRHTNADGTKTIQIPYLFVTCAPSSNFRALYTSIGRQLDRYLGNPDHECEKEILGVKRSTLGEIQKRVETMIERYAIGLIVFDEVQLMNFDSNRENSFNALMVLANETLVGIGLAGTSEALASIAKIPQISRRIGIKVPCDNYITNEDYFNVVMTQLEKYQWFDTRVSFTNPMKHEIFMESHGIIAYVILIYMMISMDYVIQVDKPEITLEYVRKVISKYFSLIKSTLNNNNITAYQREILLQQEVSNAQRNMNQLASNASVAQYTVEIADVINSDNTSGIENAVIAQVNQMFKGKYNAQHIREITRAIIATKKYDNVSELTGKVIERLMRGKSDRRYTTKSKNINATKVTTETMQNLINSDIGDPNNPLK